MKLFKRFGSLALALAMVLSVFCGMPASAEETSAPTLAVGEQIKLVNFLDSLNSGIKPYGWYNWSNGACIWQTGLALDKIREIRDNGGNIYKAVVNVETEGTYSLIYRALYGSGISPVTVKVNGTEYSFGEEADSGFSGYSAAKYTSLSGIKFNKGENEITFEVSLCPPGNNGFVQTLDYIELADYVKETPTLAVGGRLKLVDFLEDNPQSFTGAKTYKWEVWNPGVMFWYDSIPVAAEGEKGDYTLIAENGVNKYKAVVNVETAGKYTLTYGAADYNGTKTTVAVNGKSHAVISTGKTVYTGTYNEENYKTVDGVDFNQGENEIVFTVGGVNSSDGYNTALDYIGLEEYIKEIPTPVMGEKMSLLQFLGDNSEKVYTDTSTGKTIQWKEWQGYPYFTERGLSEMAALEEQGVNGYSVKVNIAEEGDYKISFGSTYGEEKDYSLVSIFANGEEVAPVKQTGDLYQSVSGYNFYNYDAITPAHLKAGENEIVLKVLRVGGGDGYNATLDYIAFDEWSEPVTAPGENLEAEYFLRLAENAAFKKWNATAAGASNGAYAYVGDDAAETASYKMIINVAEAGNYSLTVGAAVYGAADYLSPVSVAVNGGDKGYIKGAGETESSFNVLDANPYHDKDGYKFKRFALKNSLALNAGNNEIIFTVHNRSVTGTAGDSGAALTGCHAGFDYIRVDKLKTLDNLSVSVEDYSGEMAMDETKKLVVKNGDDIIKISDVASMTCSQTVKIVNIFTSKDEYYITALEPGETRLTLEIRVNGSDAETVVVYADIKVASDGDVYISNVVVDGGKVSFTVNNLSFDNFSGIAYAACYDGGALKEVVPFEIKDLGISDDFTADFKNFNSAYTVKIMLFESEESLKPVIKAIER